MSKVRSVSLTCFHVGLNRNWKRSPELPLSIDTLTGKCRLLIRNEYYVSTLKEAILMFSRVKVSASIVDIMEHVYMSNFWLLCLLVMESLYHRLLVGLP